MNDTVVCPYCGKEKILRNLSSNLAIRCSHCGKFFRNEIFSELNSLSGSDGDQKGYASEEGKKKVLICKKGRDFLYGVWMAFCFLFGVFGLFYFGMKKELFGFFAFLVPIGIALPVPMLIESYISSNFDEDDDMEGLSYQEMVNVKKKEIEKEMFWRDVREILGFLFLRLWKILKFAVILFFSILTVGAFIVAGKKK